jgi:hypothetical protein
MSFSLAGTAFYSNFATPLTTLAVSNVTIGNYRIVSIKVSSSTDYHVSSVSGGGVTTWSKLFSQIVTATEPGNYEIWGGPVTSTDAQTITVNYSTTPAVSCELWSSELVWSGGPPASWTFVSTGVNYGASGVTLTFPTLISSGAGGDQAFWGTTRGGGSAVTGTPSTGFTASAANGNGNASIFNGALGSDISYSPTVTPSPTTAAWAAWGVIIQEVSSAPPASTRGVLPILGPF